MTTSAGGSSVYLVRREERRTREHGGRNVGESPRTRTVDEPDRAKESRNETAEEIGRARPRFAGGGGEGHGEVGSLRRALAASARLSLGMFDPEFLLLSFGALATILNPIGVIPQFLFFSESATDAERRDLARRGVLAAGTVLVVVAVMGTAIFRLFGVTLPAFRVAGGALLFLIALDMLFARRSGTRTSPAEQQATIEKEDIAVFPVGVPLIAGPGSVATVLMLGDEAHDWSQHGQLVAVLVVVLFALYLVLRQASRIKARLGVIGMNVMLRLTGLILASIGAQFLLDGVIQALSAARG